MVWVSGLEPPASAIRTRHSAKLSYTQACSGTGTRTPIASFKGSRPAIKRSRKVGEAEHRAGITRNGSTRYARGANGS